MSNEHPAVAEFRTSLNTYGGTTSRKDKDFARHVRKSEIEITNTDAPHLFRFLEVVRIYGCDPEGNERGALADYDRLVAARQTPVEHPDIAAYRATIEGDDVPTNEDDERFVRAILADPRIVDALTNRDWDNPAHHALCLGVSNFLNPEMDGPTMDEAATLAAYDTIVGNVKPAVDNINNVNKRLADALDSMADTLDALADEFRRVTGSL